MRGTRAPRSSLSVIVPTLDEAATLPALLESLGRPGGGREHGPDELVVVDGGSRDGTREIAREAGAKVLSSRPGRGRQLRLGARHARGELLLFLHADARLSAGSLAAVRRALREHGAVALGLRQRIEDPRLIFRWIEAAANQRVRLGRVYGDSGLALRRADYERSGGFRALPLFEDLDLSRRLRRLGSVRLLDSATILVSPRRWLAEGVAACTLRNWVLTAAWSLGVAPGVLTRYYPTSSRAAEPS